MLYPLYTVLPLIGQSWYGTPLPQHDAPPACASLLHLIQNMIVRACWKKTYFITVSFTELNSLATCTKDMKVSMTCYKTKQADTFTHTHTHTRSCDSTFIIINIPFFFHPLPSQDDKKAFFFFPLLAQFAGGWPFYYGLTPVNIIPSPSSQELKKQLYKTTVDLIGWTEYSEQTVTV